MLVELRPDSDIDVDSWGAVPPVTYYGTVNDEPDDDDTFCQYTGTFTGKAFLELGLTDVPSNLRRATRLKLRVRREIWPDAYQFDPETPFNYKYTLAYDSTIVFEQVVSVPWTEPDGYSYFQYDEFEFSVSLDKLKMNSLYFRIDVLSIGPPGGQDFFISEVRLEATYHPAVLLSANAPINATGSGNALVNLTGGTSAPIYGTDTDGVTFFVVSDLHYKNDGSTDSRNAEYIAAMNVLPGTPYPAVLSGNVGTPRAVFNLGDTSHGGIHLPDAWTQYVADYGLDGTDGVLTVPAYEILGNHDVTGPIEWRYYPEEQIIARHGAISRSLDWNTGTTPIRLIHVSLDFALWGGGTPLAWVTTQLEAVGTLQKIIVLTHLGFDAKSITDPVTYWSRAEADAYLAAIADYNVIAHIHGHNHVVNLNYDEAGLTCFQVGSPEDDLPNQNSVIVFKVTDDTLTWAEWELRRTPPAWGQSGTKAI
ncbi:MAG: hypothetical protein GY906_18125 [bacterium]|nr:hypothetical protein [bacterium]